MDLGGTLQKRFCFGALTVCLAFSSLAAQQQKPARLPRPGVNTSGVKRDISTVKPVAVFPIEGAPDWQVLTPDGVWVNIL